MASFSRVQIICIPLFRDTSHLYPCLFLWSTHAKWYIYPCITSRAKYIIYINNKAMCLKAQGSRCIKLCCLNIIYFFWTQDPYYSTSHQCTNENTTKYILQSTKSLVVSKCDQICKIHSILYIWYFNEHQFEMLRPIWFFCVSYIVR